MGTPTGNGLQTLGAFSFFFLEGVTDKKWFESFFVFEVPSIKSLILVTVSKRVLLVMNILFVKVLLVFAM